MPDRLGYGGHALRASGMADQMYGLGSLLRDH